ncbi:EAL domain-containing protein [Butyrivibrio sp. INlla16]|uniref:EAL domain-containing protein n=1 Tax=Butyrivibrio sp. INlla16 TaxID=1520807 RepID=UPI0008857C09|nr:EAL domain-containing protein [Butyrivibrio sp. INlla16]SDB22659.1 diguanylate cyclase (GGDEF) domain-containing protein [Butyrivibrio sp. INlla16]
MTKQSVLQKIRTVFILLSVICLLVAIMFLRQFVTTDDNTSMDGPVYKGEVQHRVLLLSSYTSQYYTFEPQIEGLKQSLDPNGIEFDVMFMDAKKHASNEDVETFHNYFIQRVNLKNDYDGVILADDEAVKFAMKYKEELFTDIPVVFFGVNNMTLAQMAVERYEMYGFYENDYLTNTIELSMKMMPDRKVYYGIHDNSPAGLADMVLYNREKSKHPDYTFNEINIAKIPFEKLHEELKAIPNDAVLIYMTCFKDSYGVVHSTNEMTNIITATTKVPIMRNYSSGMSDGVLGSVGMDFTAQASYVGALMADLLANRHADEQFLSIETPYTSEFDYQLMKKFGIDEKLLPKDAEVFNRPLTFFDMYGKIFPAVGMIFLSMAFLLMSAYVTVLVGRATNLELRESKEELEKTQEKIKYQAEHDDFLDILNRRSAVDYLREHLTIKHVYSILMIDIDNFKDVNETYGHQLADEILKYLSLSLEKIAEERSWMISRYGGDEFLIMVPKEQLDENSDAINEILELFRTPIPVGDETIILSCSIGISVSDGSTLPDQHIINAEIAMYEAKQRGRNKAFRYSEEMKKKIREENKIKAKILDAFDNDGFYMVYQPQVNSMTKEVTGFEALVRMKEPGLYPNVFIPIVESSGWVGRLGRVTTELVIKQLAAWKEDGYKLHPVSINFSSNQIGDTGYVDFIRDLLSRYNIPGKYVEIEITEGLFLERTEQADKLFQQFRELGIKLLMDDFGTGYSSLGYLTYIPVDYVKLDKSLVDSYLVEGKEAFIKDVIQLVHDIDKQVIVEGVEEKWQFEKLRLFSADIIQGYYFCRPVMPDEAILYEFKED